MKKTRSGETEVVTLPNAEEIMERLKNVYDDAYTVENFYPLIAQEGGRELVAEGIVIMLTLKIHDFVASGYPSIVENILHMFVPNFIDALIDNKKIAEAAKSFHQKALDATRKE